MKIPLEELSEDALAGIIESFVLREGTDYGEREVSFSAKCAQVRRELQVGRAFIDFDPVEGSVNILPVDDRDRRN